MILILLYPISNLQQFEIRSHQMSLLLKNVELYLIEEQNENEIEDGEIQKMCQKQNLFPLQNKYEVKNLKSNRVCGVKEQNFVCNLSQLQIEKLNFQQRLNLFASLAKQVKNLHHQLICHRMLTPSSFSVFSKDGSYVGKIIRFETCLKLSNKNSWTRDTTARNLMIKQKLFEFASPEIYGMGKHGMKADIWSLGAIFNYLFYQTTTNIQQICTMVKVQTPEGTPKQIRELLHEMLQYKCEKRPDINKVLEKIKILMKCADVIGKCVPLGKNHFHREGSIY